MEKSEIDYVALFEPLREIIEDLYGFTPTLLHMRWIYSVCMQVEAKRDLLLNEKK